jgi:hypothetical protein
VRGQANNGQDGGFQRRGEDASLTAQAQEDQAHFAAWNHAKAYLQQGFGRFQLMAAERHQQRGERGHGGLEGELCRPNTSEEQVKGATQIHQTLPMVHQNQTPIEMDTDPHGPS